MLKLTLLLSALLLPLTIADTDPMKLDSNTVSMTKKISVEYKKDPSEVLRVVQAVEYASSYFNLPKNVILGLIAVESSFINNAVSKKSACGYMQLTKQSGVMPIECNDAEQNIFAGATLLDDYRNRYGLHKALEAYNAGPGKRSVEYRKKVLAKSKEFI